MHTENSFITLTYSDEHLKDRKLNYKHFQDFMKRLRFHNPEKPDIGYFVTGEYGEKHKRPHWHACIFGYRPDDAIYKYSNDRGDRIYSSESLSDLWEHKGIAEFGDVTFESAGYCARYALKKLTHGEDGTHDFEPISKKSSKKAIGKKWLEHYWPDIFNTGILVLPNGNKSPIPRYYEKWLKKFEPDAYAKYITLIKSEKSANIEKKIAAIELEWREINMQRDVLKKGYTKKNLELQGIILEEKLKQLKNRFDNES